MARHGGGGFPGPVSPSAPLNQLAATRRARGLKGKSPALQSIADVEVVGSMNVVSYFGLLSKLTVAVSNQASCT